MTMTHVEAQRTIHTARSESKGKPLENNTRLLRIGDHFGIRLHNTVIVEILTNGQFRLNSGGYETVTTMDRMRTYAPVNRTLISDSSVWKVQLVPDANDPRPEEYQRTVQKPFHAEDPGPEPVRDAVGCVIGTIVSIPHMDDEVRIMRSSLREGDEIIDVTYRSSTGEEYDSLLVKRSWVERHYMGQDQYAWGDEGWRGIAASPHSDKAVDDKPDSILYRQCPHCKEFDAVHEQWYREMFAERYGRRFDAWGGYHIYSQMMVQYDNREAWQDAYLEDVRSRRSYLQADRDWCERNFILFYDGMIVDENGYALRSPKVKKEQAKRKREKERMRKRIDKFVDAYMAQLEKGMAMPSGGDCWYCAMFDRDGTGSPDHLLNHIEDKYYVPSLIVNALRAKGYQDAGIYIFLGMDPDNNRMQTGPDKMVRKALREYMVKRLVTTI